MVPDCEINLNCVVRDVPGGGQRSQFMYNRLQQAMNPDEREKEHRLRDWEESGAPFSFLGKRFESLAPNPCGNLACDRKLAQFRKE